MNSPEIKILETLSDLKANGTTGVKAEFEAEGTVYEEALKLREITTEAGLELTIKIGGCEAVTDLRTAKQTGADTIVAPMIETPYAMKKFIKAIHLVFSEQEIKNKKFLINVETITGFNNLDDIITAEDFSQLNGVVLGRTDMTASLGLTKDYNDSEQIYNIAYIMSEKIKSVNKSFIVGGGVSEKSLSFFKKLPYLSGFETRKIIFDAENTLNKTNADKIIRKAIEFELLWLKSKSELFGTHFKEDELRIKILESIYHH